MMSPEIVNPASLPEWDDMVAAQPGGSFFHTSSWANVLVESYGYRPAYFSVIRNGVLHALLPVMEIDSLLTGRRGVSIPFSDYADPFAEEEGEYGALAESALRYGARTGWKTLEIRGGGSPWEVAAASSRFLGHRLSLAGSESEILAGFRTNMRRNIARALKEGVTIEVSGSSEAMEEYYRLHCITRKGHGIPPQPLKFFRKILEHVLGRDAGRIALASFRGRIVAGIVIFHHGKKAIYKYGASDDIGKQCRANNLVMWEAIRWYRQQGATEFCFGRTEPGNTGLREYKLGYGASEYELSYYKYDIRRDRIVEEKAQKAPGWMESCFQRVPIPVSRIIGSLAYRHVG
jgi:CelD/BcsL family acetyltransferase involved in cellulose biosynthesis